MVLMVTVRFICCFISAAEIGFAWDGEEKGWIRAALLPVKTLSGPIQQYQSAILEAWKLKVGVQSADKKGSRGT